MASEIRNRFTDTEMQIARETDLPELLSHLGYQVKRVGRFHTTAEMDSLRIKDRRTWFRYSQNTGGDAITFLQQFCGKSFDLDGPGFKGDAPGSDKNTGFSLPHDPRSDLVLVFEAPIDLMSYLTLHRDTTNAVALCGLYDGALQTYLQAHPEIRRIALCLDADEPGQKAAQQLQEKYQLQGYAVTVEKPRCGKDWNEYLQKRLCSRERGR